MDTSYFPVFPTYGAQQGGIRPFLIDPNTPLPQKPQEKDNLFLAGLASGASDLVGLAGSATQAVGKLGGFQGVEEVGRAIAERGQEASRYYGRADLETAPWNEGGAPVLPWLGYQAVKQIPTMAAYLAGAAVAPEAVVPAALSRVGAILPRFLGGGGGLAAREFAANKAALTAGKELARSVVGGTAAGIPLATGSMYQEATQREAEGGGEATWADAAKAVALSPVYSALDALQPAQLKGLLARGMEGNIAKRIATTALTGALGEAPQEGAQTALEQSFRPDIPIADRARNVIEAAVQGGLIGSVFGGAGGAFSRRVAAKPTGEINEDDLKASVDQVLMLTDQRGSENPPIFQNSQGVGGQSLFEQDNAQRAAADVAAAQPPIARAPDGSQLALPAPAAPVQPADFFAADRPGIVSPSLSEAQAAAIAANTPAVEPDGQLRFPGIPAQEVARGQAAAKVKNAPTASVEEQGQLLLTPTERVKDLKAKLSQEIPEAQGIPLSSGIFKGSNDIVDVASKLIDRVQGNRKMSPNEVTLAEKLGLTEDPAILQQKLEQLAPIAAGRVQSTAIPREEALAQMRQAQTALSLIEQVNVRKQEAGPATTATVAGVQETSTEAPVTSPEPFNTVLAEKLGPARTQLEYNLAKQAADARLAQQQAAQLPDARVQAAQNESARANLDVPSTNPVVAPAQQKTLAAFNQLVPDDVKQVVLDRYFNGDTQGLEQWVSAQKGNQRAARAQLMALVNRANPGGTPLTALDAEAVKIPADSKRAPVARAVTPTLAPEQRLTPNIEPAPSAERAALVLAIAQAEENTGVETPVATAPSVQQTAPAQAQAVQAANTQAAPVAASVARQQPVASVPRADSDGQRNLTPAEQMRANLVQDIQALPEERQTQLLQMARSGVSTQDLTKAVREAQNAPQQAPAAKTRAPRTLQQVQKEVRQAVILGNLTTEQGQDVIKDFNAGLTDRAEKVLDKANADIKGFNNLPDNEAFAFDDLRSAKDNAKDLPLPEWYNDVAETVTELAKSLGVKFNGLLVGEDPNGHTGMASETGKIIALSTALSREQAISVASHELGHLVMVDKFRSAPEATQQAIIRSYMQSMRKNLQATNRQLKPLLYSENDVDANDIATGAEYSRSFDEWFAEQVSRWLTTKSEPLSVIDKFFSGIAKLWQKIYDSVARYVELTDTVDEFMRSTWANKAPAGATQLSGGRIYFAKDTTVPGSNNRMQTLGQNVTTVMNRLNSGGLTEALQLSHLYATTVNHMDQYYGKLFPSGGTSRYVKAQQKRTAIGQRMASLSMNAKDQHDSVERGDKKSAELIRKLMLNYTGWRIDPAKNWSQHEHLHGSSNEARLVNLVAQANKEYAMLRQAKPVNGIRPLDVYKQFVASNEVQNYARMTIELEAQVRSNSAFAAAIAGSNVNHMDDFINDSKVYSDPIKAAAFWKGRLDTLRGAVQDFVNKQTENLTNKSSLEGRAIEPLAANLTRIKASLTAMEQAPYFHLGREGDKYASFSVVESAKGEVNSAIMEQVARALAKAGFDNIEIPAGTTNPRVFIRTDSLQSLQQLVDLMQDFNKRGWIKKSADGSPIMEHGDRNADQHMNIPDLEALRRLEEEIQTSPAWKVDPNASPEVKAQQKRDYDNILTQIRELSINLLPDSSQAKVLTHRDFVPGYSKDVLRSYAFRTQLGAQSLASLSTMPDTHGAFVDMRADINNAKSGSNVKNTVTMQKVFGELSQRESARSVSNKQNFLDTLRAVNHTFFLGMSPAYALIQMTQIPVLLVPELAKMKGGFVGAWSAVGKSTPVALKIMSALAKDSWKGGYRRLPDINILDTTIRAALKGNPNAEDITNLIMQLANRGAIDLGGQTREHARVATGKEDENFDVLMRYGSAFGLYTETASRIIAALAAREMYKGPKEGLTEYALRTVTESMQNYQSWNAPRAMGKQGFLGQYTPVSTAFLSYNQQLLEKLYREVHTVFTSGATPAEKAAARRFLGAHVTAVMALAGSLGLPFAAVIARVIDGAVELFGDDDQPYDVENAWRNFLADTFGKDAGEIIARGIPRAIGIDVSSRIGEQDILPLSKLLTDRREWQDKLPDFFMRTAGAPAGMISGVLEGSTELMRGNVLSGLKAMVPTAIKGPLEAYRMSSTGQYTDARGNIIPLTPSASAILSQALGFTPAERAEYSEAKMSNTVRTGILTRQATNIRNNIAKAIESGDTETARSWLAKAQEWDRSNPTRAIIPTLPSVLRARANARAQAGAFSTSLGTNIRDTEALSMSRYMNATVQ